MKHFIPVVTCILVILPLQLLIKDYSTLGERYRNLQAQAHKQGTRNLTLHQAVAECSVKFEFLVCKRVLVNPITHEQRVLQTF